MLMSRGYRPEIDGLRALAVLPVLFFHAKLPGFSGGFVGVDVFFVISGYLITAKIYADLIDGRFSFSDFYERRARRILPLLLCVIATCVPIAFFILTPGDYSRFAISITKVLELKAEVYFRKTGGYFDAIDYPRPLLHTWSLSIEEKYYIVFPIIFCFVYSKWRPQLGHALAGATLLFLILSGSLTVAAPSGSYYMFWARIWEILLGASVAIIGESFLGKLSNQQRDLTSWIGFATLILCVILYHEGLAYPGLNSVLPSLAAATLILTLNRQSFIGKIMSCRAAVFTGLLSYSIYMWHLPAFVIAEEAGLFSTPIQKALVLVGVLGASLISWRYIETPFRSKTIIGRKKFFLFALSVVVLLLVASSSLQQINDKRLASITPRNTNDGQLVDECFLVQASEFAEKCHLATNRKLRQVLLIGDSHASAIYPALKDWAASKGVELKGMTAAYCLPVVTEFPENRSQTATQRCAQINRAVRAEIDNRKPDLVVLAAYMYEWSGRGGKSSTDERWSYSSYFGDFSKSLAELTKRQNVVVVGQVPVWKKFLPDIVTQELGVFPRDLASLAQYSNRGLMEGLREFDEDYRRSVSASGAKYVSAIDASCNPFGCRRYVENEDGQLELTTFDYGHLSKVGARSLVANALGPQLDIIFEK